MWGFLQRPFLAHCQRKLTKLRLGTAMLFSPSVRPSACKVSRTNKQDYFGDITLCSKVEVHERVGETYRFHLQD
jgi:hypothetical protein